MFLTVVNTTLFSNSSSSRPSSHVVYLHENNQFSKIYEYNGKKLYHLPYTIPNMHHADKALTEVSELTV